MEKLICTKCGTQFSCGTGTSLKDGEVTARPCWCMKLPNMNNGFDLAESCLCPDCLTAGQAKAITKQRKQYRARRHAERQNQTHLK